MCQNAVINRSALTGITWGWEHGVTFPHGSTDTLIWLCPVPFITLLIMCNQHTLQASSTAECNKKVNHPSGIHTTGLLALCSLRRHCQASLSEVKQRSNEAKAKRCYYTILMSPI